MLNRAAVTGRTRAKSEPHQDCGGAADVRATPPDGVHRVDRHGFLHLPLAVRRSCALPAGSRLLLAADPQTALLRVYPEAVLDALLKSAPSAEGGS
jgi:hypothetical protein